MPNLFADLETYCETPIKPSAARYAEDAEIIVFAWAVDDEPVNVWDATNGICDGQPPQPLIDMLADENVTVYFQNGGKFDWPVLKHVWPKFYEAVPEHRRRDTMVQAYAHSLPGNLEAMGSVLGVREDQKKLKEGNRLVRLFCMPQNDAFFNRHGTRRATRATHPDDWQRFLDYAGMDITAMRACHRRMPVWNYKGTQLALEQLSNRINDRGICVDLELAQAAVAMEATLKRELAARTRQMTGGAVGSATQRDEMLAHILAAYGVDLPNMQADTIERRIDDPDLPEALRELLRVRLMSTTSSVAKFKTLLKAVNTDGRVRGTMQYRGAARTGRVGHRIIQPGNMPRPTMPADEIEWAIDLLKLGSAHLVYGNVMKVMSNAVRGVIVAAPGKKLVVSDLKNIEGRMAAWLAGEEWELQAFRDFDNGIGTDLYILAYAKSFNVDPVTVPEKGSERQIGKVQSLMFAYGGGVAAWITGAATYGIDLDAMTEAVYDTLPEWAVDEAQQFLEWLCKDAKTSAQQAKARHMLPERTFIACDAIKRMWRRAHPAISGYWKELENTIAEAIENPGETFPCRKLKVRRDGAWLRIGLPSGRALCYPKPAWNLTVKLPDGKSKTYSSFSYEGIDQYTRKWTRISSYGAKVYENVVQAAAADQLFESELLIDPIYPIVVDLHDEVVTEVDDDPRYTAEHLGQLLCSDLGWNKGLPLAASGFEAYRYRKE